MGVSVVRLFILPPASVYFQIDSHIMANILDIATETVENFNGVLPPKTQQNSGETILGKGTTVLIGIEAYNFLLTLEKAEAKEVQTSTVYTLPQVEKMVRENKKMNGTVMTEGQTTFWGNLLETMITAKQVYHSLKGVDNVVIYNKITYKLGEAYTTKAGTKIEPKTLAQIKDTLNIVQDTNS